MSTLIILVAGLGVPFLGCEYKEGFITFPFLPDSMVTWAKISTYGIMLACGFLFANFLLQREFRRINVDVRLADNIIIAGVIGGIIGAKIFFLWETSSEWSGWAGFSDRLFTGGGLTWYGGFIVAGTAILILIKRARLPFLKLADIITPLLASGYGFGRMGCLFSGDGCYGVICPYNWPAPFAMAFPHGAASWSAITSKYGDPNVVVYNTPLMEASFSFTLFIFFWLSRKKDWPIGFKFITFVALHSLSRFLVEIIRLNPRDVFGMSQGQFVSLVLIAVCVGYIVYRRDDLMTFIKGGFKWNQEASTG